MKKQPTEEARGWGTRVDGPRPFLSYCFFASKDEAEDNCGDCERPVRVVMLPLAEYRRLKRRGRDPTHGS